MIDFNQLVETSESATPIVVKKVDLARILNIPPKLSASEIEAIKDNLRKIEPGYKIPIANYQQIACWCNYCEDVTSKVINEKGTKIRCLKCKKDTLIK